MPKLCRLCICTIELLEDQKNIVRLEEGKRKDSIYPGRRARAVLPSEERRTGDREDRTRGPLPDHEEGDKYVQ